MLPFRDPVWWRAFQAGAGCALASGLLARLDPGWLWLAVPTSGLGLAYGLTRAMRPLREKVSALPLGRDERPARPSFGQLALMLDASRERVREVLRDLRHERGDLTVLLRGTHDGILVLDIDQRAVLVNEAAHRILALPANALGRRLTELVRNLELFEFTDALAAGREPAPLRLSLPRGDGRRAVRVSGTRLREGHEQRLLLVLHDVTDLQHLERVRTDFVTNVTHEMRSPLASILGFAETLAEDAEHVGPEVADAAERIQRNAKRLDDIVRDLVQLSRLEHATAPRPEPTDVAALIGEAVAAYAETAEEKNLKVVIDAEGLPPSVDVDRGLLRQALVNLIENAVKYTGERGRVTVRALADLETLRLAVIDTGPGIPPEHQDRIFERFYRVDSARSRSMGGTGLGLSIVKHAAAVHGGTVHVESQVGVGSRFDLVVPLPTPGALPRGAVTAP